MNCENCQCNHTGEYGSGRFCSPKCARGYSTKIKRKEINEKVSKTLTGKPCNLTDSGRERKTLASKNYWKSYPTNKDFDELGWGSKRKRIFIEQDFCCNKCGLSEWMGQPINLEIDHKNGINDDNTRENLEALCPNCHSMTETWRGRNKPSNNGKTLVSDKELIEALKSENNIRQALLKVGLAAKGKNYERAKKLLGIAPVEQ